MDTNYVIIASNYVVEKDLENNVVVGEIPCKILK